MDTINPYLKHLVRLEKRRAFFSAGTFGMREFDFTYADKVLRTKPVQFWVEEGERMALFLFREAALRVPAYKKFLKEHRINPAKIRMIDDFKNLPQTDKNTYLARYAVHELNWDGRIENATLFSVSSGSSGKPFFWPRGNNLELETAITHGLILKTIFQTDKRKTLFINSFSMGIYIAGVVILNSALRSAENGFPLTIITPGVELDDALRAIQELAPNYEQIIIAGYPPFVKDILDEGKIRGIKWQNLPIKFLFAAENFSEKFREYIFENTAIENRINFSANIYGSADASILGHETALTIAIRQQAQGDGTLHKILFGDVQYTPTFVQYNPILKYFENINNELLFTTYGGIPLIRYNIHDSGSIIAHEKFCTARGGTCWKLPGLTVHGKSDSTISFYGVKIYPENIKFALENKKSHKLVSGKFVMRAMSNSKLDQRWESHVELKHGKRPQQHIRKQLQSEIIKALIAKNLEFKRLREAIGIKAEPRLTLYEYGTSELFSGRSAKQKWASNKGISH